MGVLATPYWAKLRSMKMNKDYLKWIRQEFYLYTRDKENNCEPAIFYTTKKYLKWLRNYYERDAR